MCQVLRNPTPARAAFIYYNEVVRENPNLAQAQIAKKRIQELRPVVEALPGGIGPDGSGNPAVPPQKVTSGPPLAGAPDAVPVDSVGPATNSARQMPQLALFRRIPTLP